MSEPPLFALLSVAAKRNIVLPHDNIASVRLLLELMPFARVVDCLCMAHDRMSFSMNSNCQAEASPVASELETLSDLEILRILLPRQVVSEMQSYGNVGLMAMSFALRHRISQFHFLHFFTRESSAIGDLGGNISRWEWYVARFGATCETDLDTIRELQFFPLISALGIHFYPHLAGICGAADPYEKLRCSDRPVVGEFFCPKHLEERWWQGSQGSVFAKLLRLYSDLEETTSWDAEKLDDMVASFWNRYRSENPAVHFLESEVTEAALDFGYCGLEDLRQKGFQELRKRYLSRARHSHPDAGGEAGDFRNLRQHYEIMCYFLKA